MNNFREGLRDIIIEEKTEKRKKRRKRPERGFNQGSICRKKKEKKGKRRPQGTLNNYFAENEEEKTPIKYPQQDSNLGPLHQEPKLYPRENLPRVVLLLPIIAFVLHVSVHYT